MDISLEEKNAILFEILKQEIGYQKANDLYEAACREYDPVEYAVKKVTKQLETRKTKR